MKSKPSFTLHFPVFPFRSFCPWTLIFPHAIIIFVLEGPSSKKRKELKLPKIPCQIKLYKVRKKINLN
jgi:hypothetical protein